VSGDLVRAAELVARARRVCVLTGAGISAESGVPTFRGWTAADGDDPPLWARFRPEELATPEAFHADPALVWAWYDWRRGLVAASEPNAGHRALAMLEQRVPEFTLVTQNVDGHHTRAGSRRVLHLHGDLFTVRCTGCGAEREDRRHPLPELPPRCAGCGAMERPGVVWFGEMLPADILGDAAAAAEQCDVMLVVGTSAVVYPAAGVAIAAIQAGRPVIEINPEPTPLSEACVHTLRGPAGEILPLLLGE